MRPPNLPRRRNYTIGLLLLTTVVAFIVLGIRAESRIVAALWMLAAIVTLPFLLARAFYDDAASFANDQLGKLWTAKETEASMFQSNLEKVVSMLSVQKVSATIRGEGSSQFVFAERDDRAVEISATSAGFWVEFWEGDEVRDDRTFKEPNDAAARALTWLTRSA